MGKELTWEQVLKKLGIRDLSELSNPPKNISVKLENTLQNTSDVIAHKVLDNYPGFVNAELATLDKLKDSLDKIIDADNKNTNAHIQSCLASINACDYIIRQDNLSFEQQMEVLNQMSAIREEIKEAKRENWKHNAVIGGAIFIGTAFVGCVVAATNGISLIISKTNSNDEESTDDNVVGIEDNTDDAEE